MRKKIKSKEKRKKKPAQKKLIYVKTME